MGFLYPVLNSGDGVNFGRNSAWYQTGDIEVEVVIRIESSTAQGSIISLSDLDTASTENPNCNILFALELNTEQRPFYRHEYGTNAVDWTTGSSSAPPLPFGKWKRVKFTRVGTTITILIDGVVVHTSSFPVSPYRGTAPQQSLWIARTYTGTNGAYDYGRGFSIAYAQYKGPTGNVLFTYGEDPGGAPGAIAPVIGFAGPFGFIPGAFARAAQTQKADMELDGYEGVFVRPPQRVNGITYEIPDGTGGGGESEPIQTPRAYPLETSWKKANPNAFNT